MSHTPAVLCLLVMRFVEIMIAPIFSSPQILRNPLGSIHNLPNIVYWVTLHELSHALGLGHATNLRESNDLMGYGWIGTTDAILSDCDVDALSYVFALALEGSEPYPPGPGPYDCSLD